MAFHKPEPQSKSEKADLAEDLAETKGKVNTSATRHEGDFHSASIDKLDNGYTVRVTRRTSTKGKKGGDTGSYPGEGFDHHRTETAHAHANAAIKHLMSHMGTSGTGGE